MATNLIDFIRELLFDDALRQQFQDDPAKTLSDNGLGDLSADDIHDALTLMCDSQDNDFGKQDGGEHQVAAPQPVHSQSPIEYLTSYITNNYSYDDHSVDNSINQDIDNRGGNFDQDLDIHNTSATGDGAVAAGDDIEDSTITTGDGNQVGDGNVNGSGNVVGDDNQAVTGDDNTTGFGSGDVSHVGGSVDVGPGGAFSGTDDAAVDNTDNSISHSFNDQSTTTTTDSFNDQSDNSVDTDTDSHNSTTDDHSTSSHTENTTEDSFNTHV